MQSIPLAVLKPGLPRVQDQPRRELHAIHTACGIETLVRETECYDHLILHAIHTACGIETAFAQ